MTSASATPEFVRHCDVAVVGGSAAGLAAALQLSRQRRSVIVVDSGTPRNAPAAHMHGYLGLDGASPAELTAAGRAEVRSYGGEIIVDEVRTVRHDDGRFVLELAGSGARIVAQRVLAATGIADELPAVDGLAKHWGDSVINCPFCHGFEVRDRRLVVLVTHPMGLHPVAVWRHLSANLDVVVAPGLDVDAELETLRTSGVRVHRAVARRVIDGPDGVLAGAELDDGSRLDADAVVVGAPTRARKGARVGAFAPLGLAAEPHPSGLGDMITTDATGQTSVPGLYAAGNVTDPTAQVLPAAAMGSRVGAMIAFDLAQQDLADERTSGHQSDWDARYSGEQIWSGNPNGALVAEATGMSPGRALDVGAGEGGDALWLAERGWTVVASDVSARALERIDSEARRRGLKVSGLHADANAADPFGGEVFDLVTAHYASIPRTPDNRAVRAMLAAVAPGGARYYMLGSMSDELQRQHEDIGTAHQMLAHL